MSHGVPYLRTGHRLQLLQGGTELFPALVAAIDSAMREVLLETYIFDFTGAPAEVAYALERAARRGVSVRVVADGFGSAALPPSWRLRFDSAGVEYRVFSPLGHLGVLWPGNWRRLHRKLCAVDGEVAFCGGINLLDDRHDPNHGALDYPRFDFAVRATGPLVADVVAAMSQLWQRMDAMHKLRRARLPGALVSWRASAGPTPRPESTASGARPRARAALVLRDNLRNRRRIERAYLRAIGRARDEIIIANAYFVPGHRMRDALVRAARRGVRVQLLLQGRYEYFLQYYGSRPVYATLLQAGVEIYEYAPSFLHAKVAVIDGRWATVGSSNIDPLSLLLAREANVVMEDAAFAHGLRERLARGIREEGRALDPAAFARRPLGQRFRERVALVLMRLALALQGHKYL